MSAPPCCAPRAAPSSADPVAAGLADALATLADLAHRGLRHPDGGTLTRLDRTAARLHRDGLATTAELLRTLAHAAHAARAGEADAAARTWSDAAVRVAVTIEAHRETAGHP